MSEMTDFHKGAKAMFDIIHMRAANNWHNNPDINKKCEEENNIVKSWIADAFLEIDPTDYIQWKNITKLSIENQKLKSEIKELEERYNNLKDALKEF